LQDPSLKITTSIANTFTVGEDVTGQTSEAIGKFKSGSGTTLTFDMVMKGPFVAGETVIGAESKTEAIVEATDFFDAAEISPAEILATTPDGTYKKDSLEVGLLAQDVLAIEQAHGYGSNNDTSLVVDLSGDETSYLLTYEKLIPILVSAVKELSAKNDALEARIEALESA
jgi:hypothetical protein